jgi:hypothetical protein
MIMKNGARFTLKKAVKDVVVKDGFLLKANRKTSANTSWNNRFIALVREGDKAKLEWFKGKDLRNHLIVSRKGEFSVEKFNHAGPRHNSCFTVKTRDRTIHFSANSEADRDAWVVAIESCM